MRDATWRVGRKVKRTVYIGDELVGLMGTPELADEVVRAVNNRRMVESAGRDIRADRDRLRSELARERDTNADIRAGWDKALSTAEEAMSERNLARAERDQFKAERDKAYHNYKLVRAELADLRRLCADEHSREGQAMDSHVKAGVDGTVSVSTDNGRTWSVPESVKVEDGTFTARVQASWPDRRNFVSLAAESQPVQVREEAARRLRAAASIIGLAPDVSLTGTARWIEEALSVPDAARVARVLVPAEVDNPERIADRLRGLKAVQVLKQLVDAIEDDHAGDMTPLWAEAKRVLGETK